MVVPAASKGILTGMILGVARVAGETAPLLFTASATSSGAPGWTQPTASLPVMIYTYAHLRPTTTGTGRPGPPAWSCSASC